MSDRREPLGKAPYNFVPLPETIVTRYESIDDLPAHDASGKEVLNLLSGEITFNIVAETPILVGDGQKANEPREFVKNAGHNYEIPSSSLRGLIRNTVSVLSLSDWTVQMDDERFFYRDMAGMKSALREHYCSVLDIDSFSINNKSESVPRRVKAGYIVKLENGEYCIYHAKSDKVRHRKTYYKVNSGNLTVRKKEFEKNVQEGFFVEEATFSLTHDGKVVKLFQKDASFKGYLLYSGFIKTGKTKKVSAYLINEIDINKKQIQLSKESVKAYIADLKFRVSKFPRARRERMREFFELPDKKGIEHAKPCFYLEDDGITYFGFTAFLRLFYPYSTKNLLPEYITNKKSGIDYASALFGFAGKEKKLKYASRLHFHSAIIKNSVETLKTVKIQPGSPRASAYRFYLKQDEKNNGDSYTYLTKDTTIRGMKQYWIKDEEYPHVDTQNMSSISELKLLPKHVTFQAKITFDQLHEDELGLLLWALKGPKYHQIGMGKPYGFGAVKFEMVKCFVTNNQKMYKDLIDFFQIGLEQTDDEPYIRTYKTRMKELLKESGYSVNDKFELEDLESIKIFLAMKEKSKLAKQYMRYTDKSMYSKVTLPSAKQLLKADNTTDKRKYNDKQKNESAKGTMQGSAKKTYNKEHKKGKSRNYNRGTLTYKPFTEKLKDFSTDK